MPKTSPKIKCQKESLQIQKTMKSEEQISTSLKTRMNFQTEELEYQEQTTPLKQANRMWDPGGNNRKKEKHMYIVNIID